MDSAIGITAALLVSAGTLWVVVQIARAVFGTIGTGVMLAGVLIIGAWMGVSRLITSDTLALQCLGYAIAGLAVWLSLKGVTLAVRYVRDHWDAPAEQVDTDATL